MPCCWNLVIALAGSAVGILLAAAAIRAAVPLWLDGVPRVEEITVDLRSPSLDVYVPYDQAEFSIGDIVIRTRGPAQAIIAVIHARLRSADPDGAIRIALMRDEIAREQTPWRANLLFFAFFAALTAFIAIVGLYGLLASAKEICTLARQIGARVLIDGAQSVPHVSVDVQDLGCDFYVFSGHKMLGPMATGVVWGRLELLDAMPAYHVGSNMAHEVDFERASMERGALKFQAGTPDVAGPVGLAAAIDFLTSAGNEALLPAHRDRGHCFSRRRHRHAVSRMSQLRKLSRLVTPFGIPPHLSLPSSIQWR